jgi:hypothetical protein
MYYVYIYFDPRQSPPEPFYVGRGKGNRDQSHLIEAEKYSEGVSLEIAKAKRLNILKINIIRKIREAGFQPIIERFRENLTLEESKKLEVELISRIGRRIFGDGPLSNLTAGGEGRVVCHAGPMNPFYGKQCSDEHKDRLSKIHSDKTISEEQRQTISEKLKGKPKSHSTKEAMRSSLRRRFEENPHQTMFTVLGKSRQKTWTLLSPTGEEIRIKSLRAWCLEMGFSNKTLISAFNRGLAVVSGPAKGWKIIHCA